MKKIKTRVLLLFVIMLILLALVLPLQAAQPDDWKVVCHNPGLQHNQDYTHQKVLVLSPQAALAHINHGDHYGWCVWTYPW